MDYHVMVTHAVRFHAEQEGWIWDAEVPTCAACGDDLAMVNTRRVSGLKLDANGDPVEIECFCGARLSIHRCAPSPSYINAARADTRPWHVDIGYDGGLTAVVSIEGDLICDCEPCDHAGDRNVQFGAAAANAALIVEAVNAYKRET